MDMLRINGRLPVTSPAETLAICKKVQELQEQKAKLIAEHAKAIAALKAKLPKSEREKMMKEEEVKRGVVDSALLRKGEQVGAQGKLVRNECCRIF